MFTFKYDLFYIDKSLMLDFISDFFFELRQCLYKKNKKNETGLILTKRSTYKINTVWFEIFMKRFSVNIL